MDANAAAAPLNPCCKQLADRLEKNEAGRKKLRQAIAMLKEKLEGADKVLQENETLRRECEREREIALAEKQNAEKEKKTRLLLEQEGISLKESLAMAITRISCLESSQAADRKEFQQLRNEVRVAVDGVRASLKANEAAQGMCTTLEKNLTAKINAIPKAGGQNLQNGLKTLQSTVSNLQKDMTTLSTRLSTLEGQTVDKRADNQVQQQLIHSPIPAKPTETINPRKAPSRLPPKTQQQRSDLNRQSVVRDTRYTTSSSGAIEIIPGGIADILRPNLRSTTSNKRSAPAASDRAKNSTVVVCNREKVSGAISAKQDKDDAAKDGSDVTVQDDCVPTSASKMLQSISRLFQKEKRAHSKIERKLSELQQELGDRADSHQKIRHKRKRNGTDSSKAKTTKIKKRKAADGFVIDDDPEIEPLIERWLDAKRNLHSPNLPEVPPPPPPPPQSVNRSSDSRTGTTTPPQAVDLTGQSCDQQPNVDLDIRRDTSITIGQGIGRVSTNSAGDEGRAVDRENKDQTTAIGKEDNVPRQTGTSRRVQEAGQPDRTGADVSESSSRAADQNNACVQTEEVCGVFLSDQPVSNLSDAVKSMENLAGCFLDADRRLMPQESWNREFESRSKDLAADLTSRSSLLTIASSIVQILTKRLLDFDSDDVINRFGSFLYNVLPKASIDTLLRILSRFLVSGNTQCFTASITRDEAKNFRSIEKYSIVSGRATADELTTAAKILATICEISGNFRILRSITYKILRWNKMENSELITVLASLISVSKQLLSDAVIRCITSELTADQQNQGLCLLENIKVSVDDTVQEAVDTTLDLLRSDEVSSLPCFDLATEIGFERISSGCSWHIRFHEAAAALELICLHMGWEWTYNDLIVKKLWGFVAPGAAETTVGAVAHLLGCLGRLGLEGGEEMPGVDKLRQSLGFILRDEQGSFAFATRMVSASALMELSVRDEKTLGLGDDAATDVLSSDYVLIVQDWFRGLDSDKQSCVPLPLKNRILLNGVYSRQSHEADANDKFSA